MNHNQYKRAIESELSKLNQAIDRKIISGLGYHDDAKRHKLLLSQMRRLSRKKSIFFPRAFQFLSLF